MNVFVITEEFGDRETRIWAVLSSRGEAQEYIKQRGFEGEIEEMPLEAEKYKLSWKCFVKEDEIHPPTVMGDNVVPSKEMVSCYGRPPALPNQFSYNILILYYQSPDLKSATAYAESVRLEVVASGWPQEEIKRK